MKIAIVCDVLGEENNGTTVAGMNLIRHLKQQEYDITVVCADQDKKNDSTFCVMPNLNLGHLLNAYVKKVGVTLAKTDKALLKSILQEADYVHILLPFALGKEAVKIANELNLPVSASFHMQAQNFTSYFKLNKINFLNRLVYKHIYRTVYSKVDAIHYPTEFIKNVFEKNIRKKTNGYVISNGIQNCIKEKHLEKPKEFENKIVILSIGRYCREKSQDTLIKAIGFSKYKNRIQLILAGQGLKEKRYKKLAKRLPVQPIFKFYSRTEIINVLNYADLYVHPAETELEGISCLEAIACGKLTIVSDSVNSATKQFAVSEKCIFKNRNAKSLATVIDYWIEHPEEKVEYQKLYSQKACDFQLDNCMKNMEKMFWETANEKSGKKNNLL